MKKIIALLLLFLFINVYSWAGTQVPAKDVSVNTANFSNNFNSNDNSVQKVLDKVDDFSLADFEGTLDDISAGSTNIHLTTALKSTYDNAVINATTALSYGNFSAWDKDYADLSNAPTIPPDYGNHANQGYLVAASGNALYLGIGNKAADSDFLDGHDTSYFQVAGNYIDTSNANLSTAYLHSQLTTGNPHNVTATDVGLGAVENAAASGLYLPINGNAANSALLEGHNADYFQVNGTGMVYPSSGIAVSNGTGWSSAANLAYSDGASTSLTIGGASYDSIINGNSSVGRYFVLQNQTGGAGIYIAGVGDIGLYSTGTYADYYMNTYGRTNQIYFGKNAATQIDFRSGNLTSIGTANITTLINSDVQNGVTAYGWGNHANAGYINSATANGLYLAIGGDAANSALLEGHNAAYFQIAGSSNMVYPAPGIPISNGTAWTNSITDNSAYWNTAYTERGYIGGNNVDESNIANGYVPAFNSVSGNYELVAQSGGISNLTSFDTDDLSQGSTNYYANTAAEGYAITAYGWGNHAAAGYTNTNNTVFGNGALGAGLYATAYGNNTNSAGETSSAMGYGAISSGSSSIAIGQVAKANGDQSTAIGASSNAAGLISTSLGYNSKALGQYSFAVGSASNAVSDYSVSIGTQSLASGARAVAIGYSSKAGSNSFATGYNSNAVNYGSAIGYTAKATGDTSQAFGYYSNATGDYSTALGSYSFSQTLRGVSVGPYSSDNGNATTFVSTDPAFIVGNGTSSVARSNAFVVYKNGNANVTNSLLVGGETVNATKIQSWDSGSMVYPSAGIALSNGTGWSASLSDNHASWDIAYGWGNHANQSYLTVESDPVYAADYVNAHKRIINFTLVSPANMASRDLTPIFYNNSGGTVTLTSAYGTSNANAVNYALIRYPAGNFNAAAATTLLSANINTAGNNCYYNATTTFTNATVFNGNYIAIDFDNTDTPGYLCGEIEGTF